MIKSEKAKDIWSMLVLSLIGTACMLYIMYKREFAKIHLDFAFLKVPVFVGELLLFICAILLVFYLIKYPLQPHYAQGLVLIYIAWLMCKIAIGYHHWGPLAFRHAALYYYPFFFLMGFVFFRRTIFTKNVLLFLCTVIIGIFVWRQYDFYWTFTLVCLGTILILGVKERGWRIFLSITFVLAIPYLGFFQTARMECVSNYASLLLVIAGILYLLKMRFSIKAGIIAVLLIGMGLGSYKFFILGASGRTFVSFHDVSNAFQEMDREAAQKEESQKRGAAQPRPEVVKVGLYHPTGTEPQFYYYIDRFKGKEKIQVQRKTPPKEVTLDIKSMTPKANPVVPNRPQPSVKWVSTNDVVFRLFIWRDMYRDWMVHKPLFGVDLGKPFLSPTLVALDWAQMEWGRDGWIEPHNSYFNILYRSGIIGIILVILIWGAFIWLVKFSFETRSWTLLLLCAILLNSMVAANFLLILELPYTAIPFWTIAGMSFAYALKR